VAVCDAVLPDHHHTGVEIDVDPAQPGGFTPTQPTQRDQPPHREQPVAGDMVEEGGGLLHGPDRDRIALPGLPPRLDTVISPHLRLRAARGGQLDVPGRVGRQQPLPDRSVERGAQGRPNTVQCGRGWWPSIPVVGGRQRGDHVSDVPGGQLTQPDPAQMRDQVPFDVLGVRPQRARPDTGPGG
jgi:hypothetical protein